MAEEHAPLWWNIVGYFREKKLRPGRATLYRRIALALTFVFACLYMLGGLGHGYSGYLYATGWAYAFAVFFPMRVSYESRSPRGHVLGMFTPPLTLLAGIALGWVLR